MHFLGLPSSGVSILNRCTLQGPPRAPHMAEQGLPSQPWKCCCRQLCMTFGSVRLKLPRRVVLVEVLGHGTMMTAFPEAEVSCVQPTGKISTATTALASPIPPGVKTRQRALDSLGADERAEPMTLGLLRLPQGSVETIYGTWSMRRPGLRAQVLGSESRPAPGRLCSLGQVGFPAELFLICVWGVRAEVTPGAVARSPLGNPGSPVSMAEVAAWDGPWTERVQADHELGGGGGDSWLGGAADLVVEPRW